MCEVNLESRLTGIPSTPFVSDFDCEPPSARIEAKRTASRLAHTHGRWTAHSCPLGDVEPLIKPCSERDPAPTRIGRVGSNLLDARLVQQLIPASTRVVHPQASSPSFKGALRQSSPKVASPLAIFCVSPCRRTLHCVPAARRLSPSIDDVCRSSVLTLEPHFNHRPFHMIAAASRLS